MRRTLISVVALALLAGCPSYTTLQSPRTVDPGEFELTAGASQSVAFAFGAIPYPAGTPNLELLGTVGIAPHVNLFVRATPLMGWFGGGLKLRFLDFDGIQAAIAPEATINPLIMAFGGALNLVDDEMLADTSAMAWSASVPILFGIPAGEHMIIFGPKATMTNWTISGRSDAAGQAGGFGQEYIMVGGVLAFELQQSGLRILPELDVYYDVWAGSILIQGGIGVTF